MDLNQRILIIQLRAIGDVLLTTPLVRALKKSLPKAQIDFLTNPQPAPCLNGNPHIHRLHIYPYSAGNIPGILKYGWFLHQMRYEVVIDALGTPGTALLTFFTRAECRIGYDLPQRRYAYNNIIPRSLSEVYSPIAKMDLLKPLGISSENPYPELFISDADRLWAQDFFTAQHWIDRKVVALAPAGKVPARRWLPEYYAEIGDRLLKRGYFVLIPWAPGELDYIKKTVAMMENTPVIAPHTTLGQLAALLERCTLLICNCGGMKHFAVAVGTPTLSIYGASNPHAWTPPNDPKHVFVRADLECLDCGKRQCEPLECMIRVTPEMVLKALDEMEVL
jgi:lipopolysaccharide heptosyltransferase II